MLSLILRIYALQESIFVCLRQFFQPAMSAPPPAGIAVSCEQSLLLHRWFARGWSLSFWRWTTVLTMSEYASTTQTSITMPLQYILFLYRWWQQPLCYQASLKKKHVHSFSCCWTMFLIQFSVASCTHYIWCDRGSRLQHEIQIDHSENSCSQSSYS